MSDELQDSVKAMPLKEFLDYEFMLAALQAKGLSDSDDVYKLLIRKNEYTRTVNAIAHSCGDRSLIPESYDEMKVEDLLGKTGRQMTRLPNFGKKSLSYLEQYLFLFGLRLRERTSPNPISPLFSELQKEVLEKLKT
jgi:hypothetical protein